MDLMVRSKVIRIGNSRGVRIPKALLEQAGLSGEVEMVVEGKRLIIRPASSPRQGWETHFAAMAEAGDDRILDEAAPIRWDEEDWVW
jgi:antitoxin MazE